MSDVHEQMEQAEHVEHAAHSNKRIALVIAVLALFLAFSETLGKGAQTAALSANIEASDLWAFFQAKTIRQTVLRAAAETNAIELAAFAEPAKSAMQKLIDGYKKTIDRYESDPESKEGRKELTDRARETEHRRDESFAKYENYEMASAAFQIGIVLASASVITGMLALTWGAMGLGVIGLVFTGFGLFAPDMLERLQHLFAVSGHAG
jgi:oligoribonuclease NrnB/cAMP/cGMP phosphodiesterase (DHH superfamily)